ncbi:uncharacterized protein LOC142140092 [Mixophyes fleayi]|uniref:uncharacterized protein LOC142140092 n=1 Tax=Mixophyes fleayi TaxID=3061075 RepID=UPI003F4DF367
MDGIERLQVKSCYLNLIQNFGKDGYFSKSLARCLALSTNVNTGALYEMLSRVVVLLNNPISSTLETEIIVALNQSLLYSPLLSLMMYGVLCKGMKSVRRFRRWHQESQKSFHVLDHACSDSQYVVSTGTDLCCSLIRWFAVHRSLHLYRLKCFQLQNINCKTKPLLTRKRDNKNIATGNKRQEDVECNRSNDCSPELERRECEDIRIMDKTKLEMENKRKMGRAHVRHRNYYKLAPTFQQPRIFSASQKSTWRNSFAFEAGANILYNEYEITFIKQSVSAMQSELKHNALKHTAPVECNGGLNRNNTTSPEALERKFMQDCTEDELCAVDAVYSCGPNNPVLTLVQADSLPELQPCAGLCLPVQFARQLVELFGSSGVELEALKPEDFIVPLDHDLLSRIYLKWKCSLEVKIQTTFPMK